MLHWGNPGGAVLYNSILDGEGLFSIGKGNAMQNKEFYIDKDGFKLHAKLDFPKDKEGKMPILVLIHGLTGHMDEAHLVGLKDAANEVGMACLRVDMYGHGKSDGELCNHNLMEWVCEIVYVIDYASKLDFVTDIYLSGHSQGGLAVILAAPIVSDKIKALIPLSPAINIVYEAKSSNFFGIKYDANNIPDRIRFWDKFEIKGDYFRVARNINLDEAIAAYNGPVFVVHGTSDESVKVKNGIEAAEKYKNATLKLIEGDSHCYDYHLDEVKQVVKDFLCSML